MRLRLLLPTVPLAASLAVAAFLLLSGAPGAGRVHAEVERACGEPAPSGGAPEECEDLNKELLEPADAMLDRVAFGSKGTAPTDVLFRARREARAIARRTALYAPRLASENWEYIGPNNVGGRLLDIALDPDTPDTVYVASAGGGVFKSTDKGATLTSIWPEEYPQAIGALVMSPSGVLYAGTGETGPGGGSLTYGGDGLYRSRDKGKTWERLPGLEKTSRIGRIVIDERNEKRIFVAATGNLFKPTPDRGVYLSEDGGHTWQRVLEGDNETTGAADVAIDPTDSRKVFATMWDHQRDPGQKRYNGVGSGVYRSTDGGKTWARVGTGVLGPNPGLGRLGVAIDPQAPNNVYAIASGYVGGNAGFFKSVDGGTTWAMLIDAQNTGLSGAFVYGWWFGRVWVDPKSSSNIYVAGLDLNKSTNGGVTFSSAGAGMHVDQHALMWDKRVNGRMWAGNDGGLYRSDDGGVNWKPAKYQPYTQPDGIDVSEQDARRVVIGAQDNSQWRSWGTKNGDWTPFGPGGDGQRVLIDPTDQNIIYSCGQNGACERSDDGGDTGTSFENSVVSSRKLFFMPIELDPADPKRVFTGGDVINRSDDRATSFSVISGDVSNGPSRETNPLYINNGAASAIGVLPGGQQLYVGTDDGNLWYASNDGGEVGPTDFQKLSDPDLPVAYVTRIEPDLVRRRVAYVTYSGYRGGDGAAYVLRTADAGATWDNITGDLPKAPVNDINIVGDKLVVATDFGVFATRDGANPQGGAVHWYRVGRNLPLAPSYEFRTHKGSDQLFVGTFGRGVWKIGLDALEGLSENVPAVLPGKPVRRSYLGIPRTRPCRTGARLRFRVRAPKGVKLRLAKVYVGKRRVATLRGRSLNRRLALRLPRGKVAVRIAAVTTKGERLGAKRTYKRCPRRR